MNGDPTQKRPVPPQAKTHDPPSSEQFSSAVHSSSTLSRRLSGPKSPIKTAEGSEENKFQPPRHHNQELVDPAGFDNWDEEWDDRPSEDYDYGGMPSDLRPPFSRPIDGRSHQPLLAGNKPSYDEPERPTMSRSTTFHERDPDLLAARAARQKYIYASFFLVLSLVSFVVQTETAVYVANELRWKKSYCML